MIESAAQVDDGIAALDRASEEQWQRLRRQVEWASAFWLGFVFCQSPQIAATFRARIEHLLRYRARSVHVLVPPSPNELGSLLQVLFEPAMTAKGLVWVEAIRADPLRSCADQPGPWTAAWDQLLLLLNERRDALSRHLQGGLMMVAPVAVKPRARVAAPDVWSIRSVVIEVPARVERSAADSGDEIEATDGLRSPAGEPVSPARMQFRVRIPVKRATHSGNKKPPGEWSDP